MCPGSFGLSLCTQDHSTHTSESCSTSVPSSVLWAPSQLHFLVLWHPFAHTRHWEQELWHRCPPWQLKPDSTPAGKGARMAGTARCPWTPKAMPCVCFRLRGLPQPQTIALRTSLPQAPIWSQPPLVENAGLQHCPGQQAWLGRAEVHLVPPASHICSESQQQPCTSSMVTGSAPQHLVKPGCWAVHCWPVHVGHPVWSPRVTSRLRQMHSCSCPANITHFQLCGMFLLRLL